MKKFTIEWNAVMTLEDEGRPGREALLKLTSLHGQKIDLGIVTTAASENTLLNEMPRSYETFEQRLEKNGIGHLSRVFTVMYWGLTYIGYTIIPSVEDKKNADALWDIVKPVQMPRDHVQFAKQNSISETEPISSPAFSRWRNKWCDVHSISAHITAGRDVFVSGDVKNFKGQRREQIIALGAGEVCGYEEALEIARRE